MLRCGFSCFGVCTEIAEHLIILEWTTLVCTPAPVSLFMSPDVGMSTHVERNNHVPLIGIGPMECRLTLLRNT